MGVTLDDGKLGKEGTLTVAGGRVTKIGATVLLFPNGFGIALVLGTLKPFVGVT